jgi:hypothetical protein
MNLNTNLDGSGLKKLALSAVSDSDLKPSLAGGTILTGEGITPNLGDYQGNEAKEQVVTY